MYKHQGIAPDPIQAVLNAAHREQINDQAQTIQTQQATMQSYQRALAALLEERAVYRREVERQRSMYRTELERQLRNFRERQGVYASAATLMMMHWSGQWSGHRPEHRPER